VLRILTLRRNIPSPTSSIRSDHRVRIRNSHIIVGHVAGEANHAKSERIEEILSGLFDEIEELLNLYAEENEQTRG
jgi:hypothetical protein